MASDSEDEGPVFTGGSLSFLGDKKKKKKKSKKSKKRKEAPASPPPTAASDSDDDLTAAEKKQRKFQKKKEEDDITSIANKSHRERVDEFNQKLSELTELNDLPRISAAGNG